MAMQLFGRVLLDHIPQQTTDLMTRICTDYKPKVDEEAQVEKTPEPEVEKSPMSTLRKNLQKSLRSRHISSNSANVATAAPALLASLGGSLDPNFGNPSDYIPLFAGHSEMLLLFLRRVTQRSQPCDASAWNTYLELVLRAEESGAASTPEEQLESMQILKNPQARYNDEEALILVQTYNSAPGKLFMYQKLKMHSLLLQHFLQYNNPQEIIQFCQQYDDGTGILWIQLLLLLTQADVIDQELLSHIFDYIERQRVLPLLYALQTVSQDERVKLGMVRESIIRELQKLQGILEAVGMLWFPHSRMRRR